MRAETKPLARAARTPKETAAHPGSRYRLQNTAPVSGKNIRRSL